MGQVSGEVGILCKILFLEAHENAGTADEEPFVAEHAGDGATAGGLTEAIDNTGPVETKVATGQPKDCSIYVGNLTWWTTVSYLMK